MADVIPAVVGLLTAETTVALVATGSKESHWNIVLFNPNDDATTMTLKVRVSGTDRQLDEANIASKETYPIILLQCYSAGATIKIDPGDESLVYSLTRIRESV